MATKKKENNENTKVSGKKAEASAVNNAEAEAAREKFQEKLKELLSLAKKKKNMLEYQEISDFFADMQLDSDKFEKILDFLEANNIDVLRITDDDADDDILLEVDDDDEIEVEKIDLSVPDGVSIEDPVRHLILPGCTKDSKAVLKYLHETYENQIYISIMHQFTPLSNVKKYPELNRKITDREYDEVIDFAIDIGIENGFIQEGETAEESFIPEFDNEGV